MANEKVSSCSKWTTGATFQKGWRSQFAHPRGPQGWLVGQVLALKNRQRSEWVNSMLEVHPGDRVLEIGFGPGVDIQRVSREVGSGFVAGIDPSPVMVAMASKRNRTAIDARRVELRQASAESIPYPDDSFDIVFAINSLHFSDDPRRDLGEIRRVLKPGGMVTIAMQPRSKGATEATVDRVGALLEADLVTAGFESVTLERRPMKPVSCLCAQAAKPADSKKQETFPENSRRAAAGDYTRPQATGRRPAPQGC